MHHSTADAIFSLCDARHTRIQLHKMVMQMTLEVVHTLHAYTRINEGILTLCKIKLQLITDNSCIVAYIVIDIIIGKKKLFLLIGFINRSL